MRKWNLLPAMSLWGAAALVLAGCGGGGGGESRAPVDPIGPEIPICPGAHPDDDHADTRSGATALALGGAEAGEIKVCGDEDYFRVVVTQSGTLRTYTLGSLDTTGDLQAANGDSLASDDNSGGQNNFRIELFVNPGTYYIRVGGYEANTGSYTLYVYLDPGPGGINSGQIGDEFGRTSTTGRILNLTCTDDVVFSDQGNVVLPSVDVVALPAAAGTVTLEYDAYSIPDRFVVEIGGQVVIDTRYVGSSDYTVSQVNSVLAQYGFRQTTQPSIITPGSGSLSFQKPAGPTSAVVRVYAPLTGTAWEVTLTFTGASCNQGGINPGQIGDEFGRTSTTGRILNLTCTDDVVFSDQGNVVLPSVDVVALPAAAGTVTLEYDAYSIPDRFVVEIGGQVVIDTRYVGSSDYTVSQVNSVLAQYGFRQTTQPSIITPGSGSLSFQKPAGPTSAVVRVYAPLTGTAWEVTLTFTGASCNQGGINPGQIGDEFGRTSTTGRILNLTCTDDVVFSDQGNVVLPSVDVVALPAAAGTVTLEYDAYSIPDRFVVEIGGQVVIDTRYVGSSTYTVSQVNSVLASYGFRQTTQPSIITPGSGSLSFQKPAGPTSAVVRVYAPLTGTAWEVTLKFTGASCNQGGINPGQVGNEFGRTSTTGRILNLSCSDDVVFSDQGNLVLPSVDVVALPAAAGTVTLEYDAFSIPDRFVVEIGGQVAIDTRYVGSSTYTVSQVNSVLASYGFRQTTQPSIITPGSGSQSFQKPSGSTSAVVRVYAPLTGTAWSVTLKFTGASCGTLSQDLYGAIGYSLETDCSSYSWSLVVNANRNTARSEALSTCEGYGGTNCTYTEFGSAYAGNIQCGALAYGVTRTPTSVRCVLRTGRGSTELAARNDALSSCTAAGFSSSDCSISTTSGGDLASACAESQLQTLGSWHQNVRNE